MLQVCSDWIRHCTEWINIQFLFLQNLIVWVATSPWPRVLSHSISIYGQMFQMLSTYVTNLHANFGRPVWPGALGSVSAPLQTGTRSPVSFPLATRNPTSPGMWSFHRGFRSSWQRDITQHVVFSLGKSLRRQNLSQGLFSSPPCGASSFRVWPH